MKKKCQGKVLIWPPIIVLVLGLMAIPIYFSYFSTSDISSENSTVEIDVHPEGVFICGTEVELNSYFAEKSFDKRRDIKIYASMDARADKVSEVIDIVRNNGFYNVSLATIEP